jgi:hypothetical protein
MMSHAGKREAEGEEPPGHHAHSAYDEVLEINAEDSGVQLLAPVNAKGNGLRGAVVGSGRGVHAFEEEEKRGQQCGEVEESHDLHQVVVEELCGEDAGAVQQNEHSARDCEGSDTVAPELKLSELMQ